MISLAFRWLKMFWMKRTTILVSLSPQWHHKRNLPYSYLQLDRKVLVKYTGVSLYGLTWLYRLAFRASLYNQAQIPDWTYPQKGPMFLQAVRITRPQCTLIWPKKSRLPAACFVVFTKNFLVMMYVSSITYQSEEGSSANAVVETVLEVLADQEPGAISHLSGKKSFFITLILSINV